MRRRPRLLILILILYDISPGMWDEINYFFFKTYFLAVMEIGICPEHTSKYKRGGHVFHKSECVRWIPLEFVVPLVFEYSSSWTRKSKQEQEEREWRGRGSGSFECVSSSSSSSSTSQVFRVINRRHGSQQARLGIHSASRRLPPRFGREKINALRPIVQVYGGKKANSYAWRHGDYSFEVRRRFLLRH